MRSRGKGTRWAESMAFVATGCLFLACGGSDRVSGLTLGPHTSQIEVRFVSTLSQVQQNAVGIAVAKWSRALSKDLGEFNLNTPANQCFTGEPNLNETHRNLLLFISVADIDGLAGAAAFTQICTLSTRDTLPIVSHIRLDRADLDSMEARGTLQGVITHEMGHALGFNPQSYVAKGLAGGAADDPVFQGAAARAEFAKHGAFYTGATVPLENRFGPGSNDPHWRLFVFGDELMVSSVSRTFKSPLSTITLGFFQDLGYTVDFSVADPYEVTPLFSRSRIVPDLSLRDDFVARAPPTFVRPAATH
jgi:hypothetical protein